MVGTTAAGPSPRRSVPVARQISSWLGHGYPWMLCSRSGFHGPLFRHEKAHQHRESQATLQKSEMKA